MDRSPPPTREQLLELPPATLAQHHLPQGTVIVALAGALRLTWLDTGLDWLPGAPPARRHLLEGEGITLDQGGWVTLANPGKEAVQCLLCVPLGLGTRLSIWLGRWLRGRQARLARLWRRTRGQT